MAFAATASTKEPRSFSVGPVKIQILTYTAVSTDTAGTITADRLSELQHVIMGPSLELDAAITYSGNVATLSFVDPAATVFGELICIGK